MACSKYELGYEDDRFETDVSLNFHCPICFLVLKNPVMCKNHHVFCGSCIKKHLENSQTCPTCRDHVSVETLNKAPNIVTDYISELNIRCDFYSRGCPEMVQVGNLKRHVASCGFSPVQCSNEGCDAVVNARDKLHHEAEVCDFRKFICHDCSEMKDLLYQMLARQGQMKEELKNEMKNEMKGMREEIKVEVKREMKEVKNEMKTIKDELKQETKDIKNRMKGVKEMKEEIKMEVNGVMNDTREKIQKEMKRMKEEYEVELKCEMTEVKHETKSMKHEMHQESKGIKSGIKEMKDEIKGIKREIEEEMNDETKGMKGEIKGRKIETKGMKDEIKGMKDETKGMKDEIKGMKDEIKGMKDETKRMKEEIGKKIEEKTDREWKRILFTFFAICSLSFFIGFVLELANHQIDKGLINREKSQR